MLVQKIESQFVPLNSVETSDCAAGLIIIKYVLSNGSHVYSACTVRCFGKSIGIHILDIMSLNMLPVSN